MQQSEKSYLPVQKKLYLFFALLFHNNIEKSALHLKNKWKFAKRTI